jgi:hypothetical protein
VYSFSQLFGAGAVVRRTNGTCACQRRFSFLFSFPSTLFDFHLFAFHSPDGLLESLGIMLIQVHHLRQKNLSSRVIIGYKVKFEACGFIKKGLQSSNIAHLIRNSASSIYITQISQGDR